MPKISIIMSVYNGEKYLRDAIESILSQTFEDFEFIITDDNSKDNSLKILRKYSYKDNRIVIIENKKNIGLTKSLNNMVSVAKGEYIARMDADDISIKDRFEKQISIFESNDNIEMIFTNVTIIDDNNNEICKSWKPKKLSKIIKYLELVNYIPHPSIMIKANVLRENKYNEEYITGQDKELWIRLLNQDREFYFLDEKLLNYRINFNSVRNNYSNKYYKYANVCISNNNNKAAFRYFNKLNLKQKVVIIIKTIIPFKVLFYKGLFMRKFFGVGEKS